MTDDNRDSNPVDDIKHGLGGDEKPGVGDKPSDEPGGPPIHKSGLTGQE